LQDVLEVLIVRLGTLTTSDYQVLERVNNTNPPFDNPVVIGVNVVAIAPEDENISLFPV